MELEVILRKLEPLIPDRVRRWKRSLPLVSDGTRRLLERHIRFIAQDLLGDRLERELFLPPPPRPLSSGDLLLGTVLYEKDRHGFRIRLDELTQHVAIFGRSGAGKTNAVFHLLLELTKRGVPFLFLDWKRTCRHLLPLLKRPVQVYTLGRTLAPFSFNPLIPPPGLEPRAYAGLLLDLLAAAYSLGDGAISVLQDALLRSYESAPPWPTFASLQDAVEGQQPSGRARGWHASALRAVRSLTAAGLVGEVVDDQTAMVDRFAQQSTVLELDTLTTSAKTFLIPALLLWLYHVRLAAPDRERLRLVVVLEEAHHVLSRDQRRESFLTRFLRECRELGLGVLVVDQHPSLLSPAALGNTYTSICLNLKAPSDVRTATSLCSLNEHDKRFLTELTVGVAVVKLQDRWRKPFLIRFPLVPVRKGVVSDDVIQSLASGSRRNLASLPAPGRVRQVRAADIMGEPRALAFLHDVIEFPDDGVKARYIRLGFSADVGTRLKTSLVDAGFLESLLVPIGRTRKLVLRVSRSAAVLLGLRSSSTAAPTQESLAHEFWKHHYADLYRTRGYRVQVEAPRKGGRVDVLAERDSERVAIEIETGKSSVVSNVRHCLASHSTSVVVVATSEHAMRRVERQLARAGLLMPPRVRTLLVGEQL